MILTDERSFYVIEIVKNMAPGAVVLHFEKER